MNSVTRFLEEIVKVFVARDLQANLSWFNVERHYMRACGDNFSVEVDGTTHQTLIPTEREAFTSVHEARRSVVNLGSVVSINDGFASFASWRRTEEGWIRLVPVD